MGDSATTQQNRKEGQSKESGCAEDGRCIAALLESSSARECTSFLGMDPRHVRVVAVLGAFDIQVMPECQCLGAEHVQHVLRELLERTPLRWNWSLDLWAVRSFDLYFLDLLFAIGHTLHMRGGTLTIRHFQIAEHLTAFSEMFKARCAECHIVLILFNGEGHA